MALTCSSAHHRVPRVVVAQHPVAPDLDGGEERGEVLVGEYHGGGGVGGGPETLEQDVAALDEDAEDVEGQAQRRVHHG